MYEVGVATPLRCMKRKNASSTRSTAYFGTDRLLRFKLRAAQRRAWSKIETKFRTSLSAILVLTGSRHQLVKFQDNTAVCECEAELLRI